MSTLIKVDKNGTKYYANYTCDRCGGHGESNQWLYTGLTCYKCGGTGKLIKPNIYKEYTEEYQTKLDARREKKAKDALQKKLEEFTNNKHELIQKKGFNDKGKLYIVIGNTYQIKEELKNSGAKWNAYLNAWTFTKNQKKYQTIELTSNECLDENAEYGLINWKDYDIIKKLITSKLPKQETKQSDYIGNIGEKIDIMVTLENIYSYERISYNGYSTEMARIYKFFDDKGNILIWNTLSFHNVVVGNKLQVKGTIKKHSEYKDEKQTELNRCKLITL